YVNDNSVGQLPGYLNISADLRTVTISPDANLTANRTFRYYATGAADLNGNAMNNVSFPFNTTGSGVDNTPPAVSAFNPSNGASNVPTNAWIEVIFSEAVRGTSLGSIRYPTAAACPSPPCSTTTSTPMTQWSG